MESKQESLKKGESGVKRPYEKPAATLVELKPEELLVVCGKRPNGQGNCEKAPHRS